MEYREFCTQTVRGQEYIQLSEILPLSSALFVCLCIYSGPLDEDGQPHGFCTVTYSSSDRFEGHFTHGEKNGKGKFFFFDGRYWKDRMGKDIYLSDSTAAAAL